MLQRVKLEIFGQVQGVFLRKNIRDKCHSLGLGGYAKNTTSGSVEAVVEGSVDKIQLLIKWIQTHPGSSHIERITETKEVIKEQQQDFQILGR